MVELNKKHYPLRSSPFSNPLFRFIFVAEVTQKCCVPSEIIALNPDHDTMDISKGEFKSKDKRWGQKWSEMDGNVKPMTLVDRLLIMAILRILSRSSVAVITLLAYPVSTCTAERSFGMNEETENAVTKYNDRREI